jgi:hypothetical protein
MRFLRKHKTILVVLLSIILIDSCTTKKDCRGRTKHRLANGIWM